MLNRRNGQLTTDSTGRTTIGPSAMSAPNVAVTASSRYASELPPSGSLLGSAVSSNATSPAATAPSTSPATRRYALIRLSADNVREARNTCNGAAREAVNAGAVTAPTVSSTEPITTPTAAPNEKSGNSIATPEERATATAAELAP
ncbi:hypothetical protein [Lentzea sp. E54]|uniref:hypothetical protein n=1 Tax=Lentzea xerophila TaxID=3435883 RepID=UPI003DA5281A